MPLFTPIAVAIVQDQGNVLVGIRPEDRSYGGLWEFPGGKVLTGEALDLAAVRECREETGLDVQVIKRLGSYPHHDRHASIELHFFACCVVGDTPIPTPPFQWIPRLALKTLPMPPANCPIVQDLLRP